METHRHVLGAMTGTSLDGIDVVLASIEGRGLNMCAKISHSMSAELGAIAPRLRAAAEQVPLSAADFSKLALDLGELHARVAAALCTDARIQPDLACVHGQTIYHRTPASWQLINPTPVAAALNCPVVYDLRLADLAEGGQGAPLTPLADWILFRGPEPRAVVNLGGFANFTILPADRSAPGPLSSEDAKVQVDAIRGGDVCACNQLLDRAARLVLNAPFDSGGQAALSGVPHAEAVEQLISRLSPRTSTRSLGTGDEAWDAIESWRSKLDAPALLATLSEAIGITIGRALSAPSAHRGADEPRTPTPAISKVIVAGGGAFHARLVRAIATATTAEVVSSQALGVPPTLREALAWAVLGALAQDGIRVTLPAVTGRTSQKLADGHWCFPAGFCPAYCSS